MELPKGIYLSKRSNKYIAQFWDSNTKYVKCIGTYNTLEDAVIAREEFITNHQLYNGQVLKKVRKYPKGIRTYETKTKGIKYRAEVNVLWGKYNNKMIVIQVGVYSTLEEAIEARKQFILKLL